MTRSERLAWFIGEIARPWALISVSTAVAWAIFDGKEAGILAAAGTILTLLYGAKAVEVGFGAKKAADVEVAKVEAKK